jgi:type I restriction enzyme M protein
MKGIANADPELAGALPQGYTGMPNETLRELLRLLAPVPAENLIRTGLADAIG